MVPVLSVENLSVSMTNRDGDLVPVLENLSFTVQKGRTIALVGESGCGKSMTALAIMRLLPEGFVVTGGRIVLDGEDLLTARPKRMRALRGDAMSMVFQEPMTALNPLYTVGDQIAEVLYYHRRLSRKDAAEQAVQFLKAVQIPAAEQRAKAYPHQMSGGMRQRVMIAMALACRPKLLIADEPTTALDVTVQAQIFDLLAQLQDETEAAIVLITHDLGAVAELADDIAVLYAGRCIETGPAHEIAARPRHPYTRGLLGCVPHLTIGVAKPEEWVDLGEIPGMVPALGNRGPDCAFLARCANASEACRSRPQPPLGTIAAGHAVSCWRAEEIAA
ncbi:Oligopeptide transport ATP-binding protein OppD [Rhodopseudomonas palustris]|uniref:ABC transporter ATP-binding protein n=1 Tax=Rhodopseudomonas palustris (strain ATCC BAA-98 / CGA009) TaxID=258594 RepID=Q6NDK6_RHOPA|nr:ABC transporter ATP-binding protein [Rhodopseudomonas palustris]OPF97415.1 ABC transporter ATP-binding protein [Rhodopseudomonas palustris]QQM01587.1 Oligopeptide transport ATP-binding protein OppD [Rhodopseudomonas palustris]RJF67695.1 ABC transporter ATP-binding protein [Rhodopseudomonas palustris]WAB77820.1 ABC transporter ATP-binding protein [Rhodopseudomonas palustris]WCL90224.1 ABC transporter ATP-binding protein [Rhodopseudomonas palustris CGA009]